MIWLENSEIFYSQIKKNPRSEYLNGFICHIESNNRRGVKNMLCDIICACDWDILHEPFKI